MVSLNHDGKPVYKPMKDYEKRQRNKKGKYKGSIHSNANKSKKHVSLASIIFWGIFIYFVVMALANRGNQ